MRSNNFFDQFNNELDGIAKIVQYGRVAVISIIALLITGAACFLLFR